jgi:hypothetical protein
MLEPKSRFVLAQRNLVNYRKIGGALMTRTNLMLGPET